MNYHIGLVGPGRMLEHFVKKMAESGASSYRVNGLCITDENPVNYEVPVFSTWKELVWGCKLDFIVVLSTDPELKSDIRKNLPDHIDLAETTPGVSGIVNLITRSAYKRKLNKKIRFLEKMAEALPFPAIAYNRLGFVTFWNTSCERLTGIKADKVVGKKDIGWTFYKNERPLIGQMLLMGFTDSDYRQYFTDPDLDMVSENSFVKVKGFMNFRGALQGYYQVTSRKIFLNNEVIGAIQLVQDLNTLTFLQEEASKKQAALHSIVNHLPFPMIQSLFDGSVVFINRAADDLLGRDKVRQDNSLNIFKARPELAHEFEGFIRSLADEGGTGQGQERLLNKIIFWDDAHWDVTCLRPPGQSADLIWIIRNVSLKEKESQLNTALAMVGTICHELSQPLTAIINSSQLLARTRASDQERAEKHQKIISEQGERLFGIYRKLQNITQVRLQKYLDTQILDLDESSDEIKFQKNDRRKIK